MPPFAEPKGARPRIAVIVPSLGRPDILGELLATLAGQTEPAEAIIVSVTGPADVPPGLVAGEGLQLVLGPKGSCAQRNSALARLPAESDIVVFLDDDFVPSSHFLARVRGFFAVNQDVVGACGKLLADGINGPGISAEAAREMVAAHDRGPAPLPTPRRDLYGLYGCNMAFRRTAIAGIRFDERLPLYGWQEDIDFAAQIRAQGRIVSTAAFTGVHRGVKAGRSPGLRLGYSQIANPAYLAMKGTMRPRYALGIAFKNFAANHLRMWRSEPWVDRWGRARGNRLGLFDLLRGRITPERVLDL